MFPERRFREKEPGGGPTARDGLAKPDRRRTVRAPHPELEVIRDLLLYVWAAVSSFRGCDSRDPRSCFQAAHSSSICEAPDFGPGLLLFAAAKVQQ
jgi:hypothetical protein